MASKKISVGTKKQRVENAKSSEPVLIVDEVPEKSEVCTHIIVLFFYN